MLSISLTSKAEPPIMVMGAPKSYAVRSSVVAVPVYSRIATFPPVVFAYLKSPSVITSVTPRFMRTFTLSHVLTDRLLSTRHSVLLLRLHGRNRTTLMSVSRLSSSVDSILMPSTS
jgi:hypothetical protein